MSSCSRNFLEPSLAPQTIVLGRGYHIVSDSARWSGADNKWDNQHTPLPTQNWVYGRCDPITAPPAAASLPMNRSFPHTTTTQINKPDTSLPPSMSTTLSTMAPSSSVTTEETTNCRIEEITAFLQACTPNMQYLTNSFVGYGCRNREYLVTVAKEKRIGRFLRGLVIGASRSRSGLDHLTGTEILILKGHFKRYFKEDL